MNKINFQLNILQKAGYLIYTTKSQDEEYLYIMLK